MTHPATSPLGALGERELLQHIRARVPSVSGVVVGIGDVLPRGGGLRRR